MPTYQPNIPTGTVNLDVDYKNIQGNFQTLDSVFGVDHVRYSNTTPQVGYHTSIHFNPISTTTTNPPNNNPPVVPAAVAGFGQLFSVQLNDGLNTDTALYFLTGGNRLTALTRNIRPVALANGYTFLPGGLLLQWGIVNTPGSSGTVTFATANISFPTSIFSVQLTPRNDGSHSAFTYYLDGAPTILSFKYQGSTSGSNSLFWIAIGI